MNLIMCLQSKTFFKRRCSLLQCVQMLEEYEEELSTWYFKHQDEDLLQWLCAGRVLQHDNKGEPANALL